MNQDETFAGSIFAYFRQKHYDGLILNPKVKIKTRKNKTLRSKNKTDDK